MIGPPGRDEAAPYYFTYIDRVSTSDIVALLELQSREMLGFLAAISEEKSLYRYGPEKWSIRQVLNHVSDTERVFVYRGLWFARGLNGPLPSFDQEVAVPAAVADRFSWTSHIDDFRAVRLATLSFFRNLPEEAWMRTGTASGNPVTVRALAYIVAGHVDHHKAILRERYL